MNIGPANNGPYPSDLDYSICIRRPPGFCGINLKCYTAGDSKVQFIYKPHFLKPHLKTNFLFSRSEFLK